MVSHDRPNFNFTEIDVYGDVHGLKLFSIKASKNHPDFNGLKLKVWTAIHIC